MSHKRNVIVDTSYIVALFNEKDSKHCLAVEIEQSLGDSCQMLSTVFVLQEICWILQKRAGHHIIVEFMRCITDDEFIIFPDLPKQRIEKITAILCKYSDRKLDFADASLVVLANHLDLGDIISADLQDFAVIRWGNGKKSFNNLMNKE